MALPASQPAEVLRAWQKDNLYKSRLATSLAHLLGVSSANRAPAAASVLYSSCTTLRDLQTLGEEYSGIVQVDDSYNKLPSFSARALSILLSIFGDSITRRLLKSLEKKLDSNDALRPEAKNVLVVFVRALSEMLPQFERVHRAMCFINGGPIEIAKTISGIDYVQVRPAAAASYAHLRLLGLVTLAHAILACGQSIHKVRKDLADMTEYSDKPISNSCVACLEDLGMPCALPCGHVFCMQCCYSALESCALCRTVFMRKMVVPLQNYVPSG